MMGPAKAVNALSQPRAVIAKLTSQDDRMNGRKANTAALLWMFSAMAVVSPGPSQATLIYKTAPIDELQIESHERAGREDVAWVKLTGSWGAVDCLVDWGWFNSKTSPQLLAAALTARSTGMQVRVYVDDGMPKLDGYCPVTIVTL